MKRNRASPIVFMRHGADLLSYAGYGEDIIDFSSNINPLGYPEDFEKLILCACRDAIAYPDIQYRHLKNSIAEYLGCNSCNVNVGNGAVEIIDAFIQTARRVIVCVPCFSEYYERALLHKKETVYIPLKKNSFEIDVELLESNLQCGDLLILGNPNNPTGLRIDGNMLERIYLFCADCGAFLLLDEVFHEFSLPAYDSISVFKNTGFKSLAVIRAATKFFALPGIRLGYSCTSAGKAAEINKILLPWNVNVFADTAGRNIFKNIEYIKTSVNYMNAERAFLISGLEKIKGIKVFPAHSDFILIKLLKSSEEEVFFHCLKNKILIRKCSSFKGLDNTYIRIAIKNREANLKLLQCLNTFFEQG